MNFADKEEAPKRMTLEEREIFKEQSKEASHRADSNSST